MPRLKITDLPRSYQEQAGAQLHGGKPRKFVLVPQTFVADHGHIKLPEEPQLHGAKPAIMHRECTDTFSGKSKTKARLEKKISDSAQIFPDPNQMVAQMFPGLPQHLMEYKFHPTRKWRFDYYFPQQKVALEVEGAVWVQGRHTRGSGFLKDCEKYNEAGAMGIRVLRCTPQQLKNGEILPVLKRALGITTEL